MDTGQLKLRNHHTWIETMRIQEEQKQPQKTTSTMITKTEANFDATVVATHVSSSTIPTRTVSTQPATSKRETINVPGKLDIVLGRGSHSRNSPAYMRFRTVLEKHRESYDSVERCHRMVIANQVLVELQSGGCRFLKMTPNGILVECDTRESEKKISHAFRNMRLKYKKKKNKEQQQQQQQQPQTSSMESEAITTSIEATESRKVGMTFQPSHCGDGRGATASQGTNNVGWPLPSVTRSTTNDVNLNVSSTMNDADSSSSSSSNSNGSDDGAWLD